MVTTRGMTLSPWLALGVLVSPSARLGAGQVPEGVPGPIVQTANGPVQGVLRGGSVATWWGIPYAEPPLEDLRFRSPEPLRSGNWTEPLQATQPPPGCLQIGPSNFALLGQEDCLYLNVYAPAEEQVQEQAELKPVMVWLFGGGYVFGDSWEYGLYDGYHLSKLHDVVVVSLNYRLNMLGFFALDALRQEDPDDSTGNYGLQDQQLALRWVQQNIRAFGGDPERVTLFGESAGGFSVMWHLVSPTSAGLFHAAIMESGTNSIDWIFQTYDKATAFYEGEAARLGCPRTSAGPEEQLRCLRRVKPHEFVSSLADDYRDATQRDASRPPKNMPDIHPPMWPLMPFGPVLDGSRNGLLGVPIQLVLQGHFNRVPLLLGANENDGSIFLPMIPLAVPGTAWPAEMKPGDVEKVLSYFFGANSTEVSEVYSAEEFAAGPFPADSRMSRVVRDLVFLCPARALAKAFSDAGLPTFLYVFNFDFGVADRWSHLGDFHASEVPFVFKNWLGGLKTLAPTAEVFRMADIVSCQWTNFAYSHSPNGGSNKSESARRNCEAVRKYSDWPEFRSDQRLLYMLKAEPTVKSIRADNIYPDDSFPRDAKCDLWDRLSAHLPWINEKVQEVLV